MTSQGLHALAMVHGALAWCGIVALIASISLFGVERRGGGAISGSRRRAASWLLFVGIASTAFAFATGAMLHAPFQSRLRQRLFLASSTLGWLFERKEHVAFGALALMGIATCAAIGEKVARGVEDGVAREMRRVMRIAIVGAILFEAFAIFVSYAARAHVAL